MEFDEKLCPVGTEMNFEGLYSVLKVEEAGLGTFQY